MAPPRSATNCVVCLLLLQLTVAIRIDDRTRLAGVNNTSKELGYRVSRPEPKQPTKRVPAHLQDIRPGYVDDDAGDVIRIIEPPQHFQQLKRLRQRQPLQQHGAPHAPPQKAVIWEQPRKVSKNHAPPQVHLQAHPQPHLPPQAQHMPRPKLTVAPPPPNGDLLTQETQHSPQLYNGLQLPMEILASVRKTERLLQGQRQGQKLPQVRQRHIQRQTHTMIAQKALEQQLYQREQQHRLRATLSQDHKRSKRVKREVAADSSTNYGVAQGLKLVAHIGELLQNATRYLPDEPEPNELEPKASPLTSAAATSESASKICGNATNCDTRRRRRQRLFQQGSKKTAVRGRNFRHEATTASPTNARHTTKQAATTTTTSTTTTQATSSSTTSATPLASRLVNSRKSPNNRNLQHLQLPAASPRHDDSVLYADVMSNIRNLWQEHDLAEAPQFVAPREVANNTDYRALNVYLHELDQLSKSLSTVPPPLSLNQQEFARATPPPSWYLINNEGKIYETHLDSNTKPTAALFHQFPDMPEEYEPVTTQDLE